MRLFQQRIERKTKASQVRETKQLLVFRLQDAQFGITFEQLYKVLPLTRLGLTQMASAGSYTTLDDRDLQVVNIAHLIFPDSPIRVANPEEQFVIVIEASSKLLGILIDSQPALRRFPIEVFRPLTVSGALGEAQFISGMVDDEEATTYFVLDPQRLVNAYESVSARA